MKKRLFLTGASGCGKSTMLQRALGERKRLSGGFLTLRDQDSQGRLHGFHLRSSDGSGHRYRFLDFTEPEPRLHLQVFSTIGVELLHQAARRPFAVLDEIGGIELLDERFVSALDRLFESGTPCIGVMKGPGPASMLIQRLELTEQYETAHRELYCFLKQDEDSMLVETTGRYDVRTRQLVERWVEAYANG